MALVLGVVFGLRQNYRERLRQFEAMYVKRYWRILDDLSLDALKATCPAHVNDGDEKAIRSYILLCEDELEMRKGGYISDGTYKVWAEGMRSQLRQSMFEKVWMCLRKEAEQPHAFPYKHLQRLLNSADINAGDPLSMSVPRRWLRGLAGIRGV